MKVLVTATGKEKKDSLDSRFGRCPFFQIYDTENGEFKVEENTGINSEHGAGIAAAQQAIDAGVEAVVTGFAGPNAFKVLNEGDIKIYKSSEVPCEDAIRACVEGILEEINVAKKKPV